MSALANREEYDQAREAVKRGAGSKRQLDLVAKEAKQAGHRGSAARDAIQKAPKR